MRVAGWQPLFVCFSRVFSFLESGFFVFQLLFSFFRPNLTTNQKGYNFAPSIRINNVWLTVIFDLLKQYK